MHIIVSIPLLKSVVQLLFLSRRLAQKYLIYCCNQMLKILYVWIQHLVLWDVLSQWSLLSGVINSIINYLRPPKRVGIVKSKKVNSLSRILVTACIYFLMAVSTGNRNHLIYQWKSALLHVFLSFNLCCPLNN